MGKPLGVLAVAASLWVLPAWAQAIGTCVEDPARPVPAAWRTEPRAIAQPGDVAARPDMRVRLALRPTGEVRFVQAPERRPEPSTRAAILRLAVPQSGTWRVHLSSGAWVDMVQGGLRQASVAHGQWAPCAGVPKVVDFRLRRGEATIQLSGVSGETIDVLVTRAPG